MSSTINDLSHYALYLGIIILGFSLSKRFITVRPLGLLIVFVALIGILIFHPSAPPAPPTQADIQKAKELEDMNMISTAEDAVTSRLKDASSAQFKDVYVQRNPGMSNVCGEVNAKNGFGGYSGYQFFLASANGALVVMEGDISAPEFRKVWNRACTDVKKPSKR